jgi:hypothetical protein
MARPARICSRCRAAVARRGVIPAVPTLTPVERDRTTSLHQGDLLRASLLPLVTVPATSVHQNEFGEAADIDTPATVEVEIESGLVAVVSGDRDLGRGIGIEPTVVVAPVFSLEDDVLYRSARNGSGSSRVFSLPARGIKGIDRPAIDIRWLYTLEKTVVLSNVVEVLPCPLDQPTRDRLRLWLGRRLGRINFPGDIQRHVVEPLAQAILRPRKAVSEVERLREAACWFGVRWTEGSVAVDALVVLDPALRTRANLDEGALRGAQGAIVQRLRGRTGSYTVNHLTVADADEISLFDAQSYRQFFLDPLDPEDGEFST